MKLHALRDRKDDAEKDFGRHHALDLYTLVAMTTESEWNLALELSREHRQSRQVTEARDIIRSHFSTKASVGFIRMREHKEYRPELQLDDFREHLWVLFDV